MRNCPKFINPPILMLLSTLNWQDEDGYRWTQILHQMSLHTAKGIRWGTPGDEADVSATKLPFTYQISTLSFPLQSCRSRYDCIVIFLKIIFCIRERQLWSGNESVEIRYVNGSFVAGTSALSPDVPRQMFFFASYLYFGHTYIHH